jgi:hypothetical protein
LFIGAGLAPITAALSGARHARMFHPDGVTYEGMTEPSSAEPELLALGERLRGKTLLRFSSALWRGGHEWPDVLGVALRFGWGSGQPPQDLLLATIRFPWTMPVAPLATRVHSFLWNHYHAVSPFELPGMGRIKLRLRSPRLSNITGVPREQHLRHVTLAGRAVFELELRRLDVAPLARHWESVARVQLTAPCIIDQASLRFSPFHDAARLEPVGFVHALRHGAYAGSQAARPATDSAV